MVSANVREHGGAGTVQLFSASAWNFGLADSPRDLDDYLDDFEHFNGPEPWLDGISRVEWSNFFLVYPFSSEQLSKRARELIILYCLGIVERYAARFKRRATLAKIQELMAKDYREEYDNPVFQFSLALRDKVINQAVLKAVSNR